MILLPQPRNFWDSRCAPPHLTLYFNFWGFFLQYWGLNSGPKPWATMSAPSLIGFFEIGSHGTICLSWSLPLE
jgi:hypothetical protein